MKRFARKTGQVSIETLAVMFLWVAVCFFFLSVMFLIASMMVSQAGINRTIQQIASLGCVPDSIAVEKKVPLNGIGVGKIISVDVTRGNPGDTLDPKDPASVDVPSCKSSAAANENPDAIDDPVASGQLVKLTVQYEQSFLSPFSLDGKITLVRSATSASGRLEQG